MLEINKKQLMSFDEINRLRILKYIALGLIKYKESETNEFYNKEVYINIENGNIISIFSNTVKIKTKLGLNSKLINYKNIFIFIIDLRTVLVIPNRVLENLQDKEQFFKVLNNS